MTTWKGYIRSKHNDYREIKGKQTKTRLKSLIKSIKYQLSAKYALQTFLLIRKRILPIYFHAKTKKSG